MDADYRELGKHIFGEPAVISLALARADFSSATKNSSKEPSKFPEAIGQLEALVDLALSDIEKRIDDIEKERRDVYTLFLALRHTDMKPEYDRLGWIIPEDLREILRNGNRAISAVELGLRQVIELAEAQKHAYFPGSRPDVPLPDLLIHLPGGDVLPLEFRNPVTAGGRGEARPRIIKEWTEGVARRRYGDAGSEPAKFIILYPVPGLVWDAPLGVERALVDNALEHGVILAGPITLYLILRMVACAWSLSELLGQASWIGRSAQGLSWALQGRKEPT